MNTIRTRLSLALSAVLLSGCIATLSTPSWLPGTFNDDTPMLAQLEPDKYRPSLNAQGIDIDVRQQQSSGLGLLSLPSLEGMLNDQLQTLKEAVGFPELPGKVYVMASPTMNAMAKADGNIYIPIGMIRDVDSTDEMMALLSHEMAHVLLNHTDTDLLTAVQKKGAVGWAIIQQFADESGDGDLTRRARNTLTFSTAIDKLLHPTWNRQQELAADKLGIDILVAAGHDPNAMIVLLRRLDNWKKRNQSLEKENQERSSLIVNALTAKYAKEGWQVLMMQALTPVALAIEDEIEDMAKTHQSSEERLAVANDYLRQHYRRATRPAAETKKWRSVAHSAEVKRQVTAVTHAYKSYDQLVLGDGRTAANTFRRIPAREGRRQNYYRLLLAMLAESRNKPAEVVSVASTAKELRYPSYKLMVMEEQARQTLSADPRLETVQALYEQFDNFGRPSVYYADLLQLAKNTGNQPFLYSIKLRCFADNFGVHAACDDSEAATAKAEEAESSGVLGNLIGVFGRFK